MGAHSVLTSRAPRRYGPGWAKAQGRFREDRSSNAAPRRPVKLRREGRTRRRRKLVVQTVASRRRRTCRANRQVVGDEELVVRIRRLVGDGGLVVRMAKSLDRAVILLVAMGPDRCGASLATCRGSRADLANPSLDPRHNSTANRHADSICTVSSPKIMSTILLCCCLRSARLINFPRNSITIKP